MNYKSLPLFIFTLLSHGFLAGMEKIQLRPEIFNLIQEWSKEELKKKQVFRAPNTLPPSVTIQKPKKKKKSRGKKEAKPQSQQKRKGKKKGKNKTGSFDKLLQRFTSQDPNRGDGSKKKKQIESKNILKLIPQEHGNIIHFIQRALSQKCDGCRLFDKYEDQEDCSTQEQYHNTFSKGVFCLPGVSKPTVRVTFFPEKKQAYCSDINNTWTVVFHKKKGAWSLMEFKKTSKHWTRETLFTAFNSDESYYPSEDPSDESSSQEDPQSQLEDLQQERKVITDKLANIQQQKERITASREQSKKRLELLKQKQSALLGNKRDNDFKKLQQAVQNLRNTLAELPKTTNTISHLDRFMKETERIETARTIPKPDKLPHEFAPAIQSIAQDIDGKGTFVDKDPEEGATTFSWHDEERKIMKVDSEQEGIFFINTVTLECDIQPEPLLKK